MLRRLFQTDPDNPGRVVTSGFYTDGVRDYSARRYNKVQAFKLSGRRNRDGSYDVIAHCRGIRADYKQTVRYALGLEDMLRELKAFEDEGMAKENVPFEPDRQVYLQRKFIGKRGSNHVYTVLKKRAANAIETAARTTGGPKPQTGTAMRLAKLRRNPRG